MSLASRCFRMSLKCPHCTGLGGSELLPYGLSQARHIGPFGVPIPAKLEDNSGIREAQAYLGFRDFFPLYALTACERDEVRYMRLNSAKSGRRLRELRWLGRYWIVRRNAYEYEHMSISRKPSTSRYAGRRAISTQIKPCVLARARVQQKSTLTE